MLILPTDASVMTHHPALAIRESATVQLTGLILIVAACPVITAMAGSLETLLLAHAVSLLAGGLLLQETRTDHQTRSEVVRQSHFVVLHEQLQSRRTMGVLSFVCVALAFTLLFSLGGSSSLESIEATLRESYRPARAELIVGDGSILGVAAVVLLFVGVATQFGLFPMHGVLMNSFDTAPATIAGLSAVLQRCQAAIVLWKVASVAMPGFESTTHLLCLVFGTSSCVGGAILVCRSESLRSLVSTFWITWGGVTLVAAATGVMARHPTGPEASWQFPTGIETAAFAMLISSVALGMLVACDRWLALDDRSIDFVEDVTGLGQQHGLIAFSMTCSLLTLCGIPPLPGFWCASFVVGNSFLPGIESTEGPSLIPDPSVLVAASLLLVSLLVLTARTVSMLSLMFHHEPIRRFNVRSKRTAAGISVIVAAVLLWMGIDAGTMLAWLHALLL